MIISLISISVWSKSQKQPQACIHFLPTGWFFSGIFLHFHHSFLMRYFKMCIKKSDVKPSPWCSAADLKFKKIYIPVHISVYIFQFFKILLLVILTTIICCRLRTKKTPLMGQSVANVHFAARNSFTNLRLFFKSTSANDSIPPTDRWQLPLWLWLLLRNTTTVHLWRAVRRPGPLPVNVPGRDETRPQGKPFKSKIRFRRWVLCVRRQPSPFLPRSDFYRGCEDNVHPREKLICTWATSYKTCLDENMKCIRERQLRAEAVRKGSAVILHQTLTRKI